ncbi:MAG: hypothetical protein ABII23_00585 [bacterium]
MGKLYYVAPWPVGSIKKTEKFYSKALNTDNTLIEPHYYLGMIYMNQKNYVRAQKEFKIVIDNLPHETEKHYIHEFKKQSESNFNHISDLLQGKTP